MSFSPLFVKKKNVFTECLPCMLSTIPSAGNTWWTGRPRSQTGNKQTSTLSFQVAIGAKKKRQWWDRSDGELQRGWSVWTERPDYKVGWDREEIKNTKVLRASMALFRTRNTTCALCSKQGRKRCKEVIEMGRGQVTQGLGSHRQG